MLKEWGLALVLGGCLGAGAIAEEGGWKFDPPTFTTPSSVRTPATSTSSQPEPTLPEVEVQPPDSDLPPVDVTPDFDFEPDFDPFDLPQSYPDLMQLNMGEMDGAMRGFNKPLFDMPGMGTVVNPIELREKMPQDMYQALQQEVGVLMQRTAAGQSSPFVRGLTGQELLLLIDGIRMNNSIYRRGPNQYFNTIDPGMVQQIEVLRGPQSVYYGSDAIAGVINVITRSPSNSRGNYGGQEFREYFGSADISSYSRGNVEGWVGQTGAFGGGSYINVRDVDTAGDLGRQPNTNWSGYAGDIKLNYMLDNCNMFTLALQHYEQLDVPRSDRFDPFRLGPPVGTLRPTFFDTQQRDLVYARVQGTNLAGPIDGYMITASFNRQKENAHEFRNLANDIRFSRLAVNTFGLNVTMASEMEAGRLVYGGDVYYDDISSDRYRFRPNNGTYQQRTPPYPDGATYGRYGVFAAYDVEVTDDFNILAGMRYEYIRAEGVANQFNTDTPMTPEIPFSRFYDDWVGNLGFVYEVSDQVNFVGGFSEGFRAPNMDDLASDTFVNQGGQSSLSLDVKPEHAYNFELGLKVNGSRFRGQLFYFWNDFKSAITREPDPTQPLLFSRFNRDIYINGVETVGEYLLGDGWSVYGNFWYTYGELQDSNQFVSRIPPTQGIAGLRWRDRDHRNWFDVWGWFVRDYDRYAPENLRDARFPALGTPGYALLNMRAGTTLGCCDQHLLSISLENITNEAYRVLGSGTDGTGFNAILGYTFIQ